MNDTNFPSRLHRSAMPWLAGLVLGLTGCSSEASPATGPQGEGARPATTTPPATAAGRAATEVAPGDGLPTDPAGAPAPGKPAAGDATGDAVGDRPPTGSSPAAAGDARPVVDADGDGIVGKVGQQAGDEDAALRPDQTWDRTADGARLILAFDAKASAFVGVVQNTSKRLLKGVTIRVSLADGTELAPVPKGNLLPGERLDIRVPAQGHQVVGWLPRIEQQHD